MSTYGLPDPYNDKDPYDTGNQIDQTPTNAVQFPSAPQVGAPPAASGGGIDPKLLAAAGGYQTHDLENIKQYGPEAFNEELRRRAGSTQHRTQDSQSAAGNALYGSGSGNLSNRPGAAFSPIARPAVPSFQNAAPIFDDPASRLIEDYSLDRFRQRQNPDPSSGTALFEQMARDLVTKLQGPVYSAQDESIIKGRVTDQLAQEQDQAIQQWLQAVSQRGLAPSSGPALEGILRIKQHFQQAKTAVDAQFARDAIQQTRTQRFQALDTAGKLAGSEEGRLTEALTYASLPKQLADNSFQQGLQLVGAGGNPASMLGSALSIYNSVANNNRLDSQQRSNALQSIFEYLGGLDF